MHQGVETIMTDGSEHDERTMVESVLEGLIPGYRGYLGSESVSESDSRVREFLASSVGGYAAAVERKMAEISRAPGGLAALSGLKRVLDILGRVAGTIKFAPAGAASFGYSGFDDERRRKLKAFDDSAYMLVQKCRLAIEELGKAADAPSTSKAAAGVVEWASEFENLWKTRETFIGR